jgi:hypothetical protein
MNILFDDTFQSAGLENILTRTDRFLISINLGIIAIGLSFSRVGGYNIVAASAPQQYSGVTYGMRVSIGKIVIQ